MEAASIEISPCGATEGTASSHATAENLALSFLLLLLTLAAAWFLLAHPKDAVWDQAGLLEARFSGATVPSPNSSFTAQLLVASLAALTSATGTPLNAWVRVLALVLYVGSAFWLARVLLARKAGVAFFLLFLFSAQFPLLWLSTELVAGAFLFTTLAAAASGRSGWIVGGLLALLALCKPEMILVAVALLGYWSWKGAGSEAERMARCLRRGRWSLELGGSFVAALCLLLLPGIVAMGMDYFNTYAGETAGGRSFASFSQHYAVTIAHFQLVDGLPNPWQSQEVYVEKLFPGAGSMLDVITDHSFAYLEFIALACVRGIVKWGYVLNYAVLAIPFLMWGCVAIRPGIVRSSTHGALWVSLLGCLPLVLFAYPHIRYFARYYPIFVILMLAALERIASASMTRARQFSLVAAALLMVLSLATNTSRLATNLVIAPQLDQYWFPD